MTPGQIRVLVLLIVLFVMELIIQPSIHQALVSVTANFTGNLNSAAKGSH